MRIEREDTLALIIDFQERLMPAMNGADELLHNTEILIKGFQVLDVPMLVTQQYTKGLGMTIPELIETIGEDFSYYDKLSFSCAENEEILKKIEESGKKIIILCGIEAHICVLQTAIDLIAKGYHVILVENCIGSRKEQDKATAIKRAMAEGILLASYESILMELTRVAGTEVFKTISKLIK
ncbi:MAG: hypothetical protein K0S47_3814 [Herbinix sp.]|nr:hypothetical protein [Herbinix sp.]